MQATITVQGIVQGVGFRPFVYRLASVHSLTGFVRNQGDLTVLITVQGTEENICAFLTDLERKKPPLAIYYGMTAEYSEDHSEFSDFKIIDSTSDKQNQGSVVGSDTAVCGECIKELNNSHDRRFRYPLISCNDCGPRFSIVSAVPYDRQRTSMNQFVMCRECWSDYMNASDRRFHSQTMSCSSCGPRTSLVDKNGESMADDFDAISLAAKFIEEGKIVAIKGIGGFHIATSSRDSKSIARLRIAKSRKSKPFAVMVKDVDAVKSFARLTDQELQILSSPQRPILLLKKNDDYSLSPLVAPDLQNIGVMLSYTAVHHLLFGCLKHERSLVMTSANASGTPIISSNNDAVKGLAGFVDFFLVHDRDIINRCDDSVVQVSRGHTNFIRRSRGYVPSAILLRQKSSTSILALGAELNVTACVVVNDKAFLSQHIGDIDNLETYLFLKDAIRRLIKMTHTEPQLVACDLHPSLNTTRLASVMAEEMHCKMLQVQHHHAHVASVMAEHNIDEMIGIACDGIGYGQDGKVWGGEILLCSQEAFSRVGGLANQPMIGGDMATNYPLVMAAGMLNTTLGSQLEGFLRDKLDNLPNGTGTVDFILKQLEKRQYVETSSAGRVLDAISAVLGICYERTYEGEPAMKLAASASLGHDVLDIEPKIDGSHLDTTYLMSLVYENRQKFKTSDLACSAESYLARGLADIAIEHAKRSGVRAIGFSGGVAYDEHIASIIRDRVEQDGLTFVANNKVPAGDGGISLGQAYVASKRG